MIEMKIVKASELTKNWQEYIIKNNKQTFAWTEGMTQADFEMNQAYYLIVEDGEQPVAYLSYHLIFEEKEIIQVFVEPNRRQEGIGKAMIRLLQVSQEPIFLEVRESNLNAIRLYNETEFNIFAIREGYYKDPKESALIMKWEFEKEV